MLKQFFIRILIFSFFICRFSSAFPIPAYPYFVTVTQANGEKVTVKMKGDERIKWMESEDGYSLLYDNNKNIVYATRDENGNMTPSIIRASDRADRSPEENAYLEKTPKGLQYSEEQKQMSLQIWEMTEKMITRSQTSPRSTIGTARAICALIQFPDKSFNNHNLEDFEALMNQSGYNLNGAKGSVRDFYLENSYGNLELEITVVGIYTASKNWAYYGENDYSEQDKHPEELAKEAAIFAFNDPSINLADYDNDKDGFIDTFHVIFAGYGEESGADPNAIWSHKYGFYPALSFGEKKLNTYSCSPELRGNSGGNITYIGAICHELCHIFGAPDFYDADGTGSGGDFLGTGNWDLMAGGSWNGSGARPAHINMYQKIIFGWVDPIVLNSRQTVSDMPNSAQNRVAYIINTSSPNEYYVLENRQRKDFDTNVPGHGLLIYHVSVTQQDISYNRVNNGHPQRVYPVYANLTTAFPSGTVASYGSINSSLCTFTTSASRNSFSASTTPAMRTWAGESVDKPITQIKEANDLISFEFMKVDLLLNLSASVAGNQVTLEWDIPDVEEPIKGYNVYCDNKLLITTNETMFRDYNVSEGIHTYGISVLYENNESDKEEINVYVGATSIHPVSQNQVSAYPNPIEKGGLLTIHWSDAKEEVDLLFYDLSGRLIQKQTASHPGQYTVNLPSGMYFLKIIKEKEAEILKLIVK